jgi:ATP-dependent RNA helicase HelY
VSEGSLLSSEAEAFFSSLTFRADRFQREAVGVVDRGESVVVTAPTGSGKTLIAEAAVHITLSRGQRAFYTAPIKALSNQKFSDFRQVYGDDRVGLLTGDNVINGDAPLVVMTTEVLRNMIYSESNALDDLGVVVLDEVHYLQNRNRGSVWEEIIIHLPAGIQLVNLSATVANDVEFTDWMRSRRGPCGLVTETHRPVPLESMYLMKDRYEGNALTLLPLFAAKGTRVNPQLARMRKKGRGAARRLAAPRRLEVAEEIAKDGLLPAIYFIFSRVGCEKAAALISGSRLQMTTTAERHEIRQRIDLATQHLSASDLSVLGFPVWASQLERGVAAHHAGMVPAFKEAVEDLFASRLVKLVFATETLSLGINMPARTVVLERLSKFTGETHETLTPGDYTQLTGRAGRRGIDTAGTAIVLYDERLPVERVADIAREGSRPLRSSFQPSYNMAVNVVANYERGRAEELLGASFAEFRRARRQSELQARIEARTQDLTDFRQRAECDLGDIEHYLATEGGRASDHLAAMRGFAQRARSGDVLNLGDDADRWVLMARGWGASPRLLLLSEEGDVKRVAPENLPSTTAILGAIDLPKPIRARDTSYHATVTSLLRAWEPTDGAVPDGFRHAASADPVASCPDLADHLGWIRRIERVERELTRLDRKRRSAGAGFVARFERIRKLLDDWGYLAGWTLTDKGARLRFVYNELDLLIAESIQRGVFDDLDAASVVALASIFTYQARSHAVEEDLPNAQVATSAVLVDEIWRELVRAERDRGLPETRQPEPGFAATAHAWAAGRDLDEIFDEETAAGDFVRNCRQLLDLLRQLRDAFPALQEQAAAAVQTVDRGIVAASGRL